MSEKLVAVAHQHAPCYLYEYEVMSQQVKTLQGTFPNFDLLSSVKANPYPPVVKELASFGIGADAASAGEVALARDCGMWAEDIFFSAAGKSDAALLRAWDDCEIIADSLGEVARIGALAAQRGDHRAIGIRMNPAFAFGGGEGVTSKFGIDEEDLPRLKELLKTIPVTVEGLHVHLRSQTLEADALGRCYQDSWALAKRLSEEFGAPLRYVNFGSGVGIAYDEEFEAPMDLEKLSTYTDAIAAENETTLRARLMIETGRFLTCKMGTYWLPVVDKKTSRGVTYVITEGCMNGLQKPALAVMLHHADPEGTMRAYEPLYTSAWAFPVVAHGDAATTERVNIVGNLCCAADVLVENFEGPRLDVGDLVEVKNAGAYACTLTAQRFSGHTPPAELLLDGEGNIME